MNGVNSNLQAAANEFLTNKRLAEQRYETLLREVEELERRVSKVARTAQPIYQVAAPASINAAPNSVNSSTLRKG